MPDTQRPLKSARDEISRFHLDSLESAKKYNRYLRRLCEDVNEGIKRGWIVFPIKGARDA